MSRHEQAAVRSPRPKRRHLDRRVKQIFAADTGGDDDDDELLTTQQVAEWFAVSVQWLEIGRVKNYGPKFKQIGPRCIRYSRGDCRNYLRERTFASTAAYAERVEA